MSLRTKTILGIALIEALLLILLISMTLNYLRTTNYDSLEKRAKTTATLFATTTKDAILSYDLASLEAFVNEVLGNPDLSYARVLGPNGEVFAEAGNQSALAKPFVQDDYADKVTDGIFDTSDQIIEADVLYGRVEIGLDINSITQVIEEAEQRSISIAAIEMGLVALFSFALGTYLTRQLKVLMNATRVISSGKLDIQIPVKGKDELASVSKAFNAMISNLQEVRERRDLFESKLKELNQTLEERVEQRTKIILDKNKKLEAVNKEIKETQNQLVQSDKMASVGVLAAGVAHEINNPMSFISSNIESLEDYMTKVEQLLRQYEKLVSASDKDSTELHQVVEEVKKEIDLNFILSDFPTLLTDTKEGIVRVKEIVKGLKDFSHTDHENTLALANINECIETTLKVVNNELKYHCKIITDLKEIPKTYCSVGQIQQVLLNLLINAGHAIKENGIIQIKTGANERFIRIRIQDNGCGISPKQMEKLFDPFFTTKPIGQGTGLGLSISYGIIEEHGGKITVQSEVGKGSIFTIMLPIKSSLKTTNSNKKVPSEKAKQ